MNRNVLIVGGSDGIGLACARRFGADGDRVCNLSRRACDLPEIENFLADVADPGQLDAAFGALRARVGRLDLLLWFAGRSMAAPVPTVREEDVLALFDVNFLGAFRTVQRAVPLMNRGGKMLFASSAASVFPVFFDGFYSASKAALEAFAAELGMELARHDISSACVRIGGTRTRFTFKRKIYPPEQCGEYAESLAAASGTLARIEQQGMSPERVAEHFFRLAAKKKPPRLSTPGAANKLAMAAARLLPDRLIMALNRRVQSGKK